MLTLTLIFVAAVAGLIGGFFAGCSVGWNERGHINRTLSTLSPEDTATRDTLIGMASGKIVSLKADKQ